MIVCLCLHTLVIFNAHSAGCVRQFITPTSGADMPLVVLQSSFVGVVQTGCPIHEVILDAVEDARAACKMHLRDAPNVLIDGMKDMR